LNSLCVIFKISKWQINALSFLYRWEKSPATFFLAPAVVVSTIRQESLSFEIYNVSAAS